MLGLRRYQEVEVTAGVAMEGRFEVELRDARSGDIRRRLEFKNIILNTGLNNLMGNNNYGLGAVSSANRLISGIAVGSGNTAPDATDTGLETPVAHKDSQLAAVQTGWGPANAYFEGLFSWQFNEDEANGANLAEVGVFRTLSGGNPIDFWCRQLFKDELGDPTTIAKTTQEILIVRYELRVYPRTTPNEHTVDIGGVTYNVDNGTYYVGQEGRWSQAFANASGSFPLGFLTSTASSIAARETDVLPDPLTTGPLGGTRVNASLITIQSYSAGTFARDFQAEWNPDVANFTTGIGMIELLPMGNSAANSTLLSVFDPKIPKDEDKKLITLVRVLVGTSPPGA